MSTAFSGARSRITLTQRPLFATLAVLGERRGYHRSRASARPHLRVTRRSAARSARVRRPRGQRRSWRGPRSRRRAPPGPRKRRGPALPQPLTPRGGPAARRRLRPRPQPPTTPETTPEKSPTSPGAASASGAPVQGPSGGGGCDPLCYTARVSTLLRPLPADFAPTPRPAAPPATRRTKTPSSASAARAAEASASPTNAAQRAGSAAEVRLRFGRRLLPQGSPRPAGPGRRRLLPSRFPPRLSQPGEQAAAAVAAAALTLSPSPPPCVSAAHRPRPTPHPLSRPRHGRVRALPRLRLPDPRPRGRPDRRGPHPEARRHAHAAAARPAHALRRAPAPPARLRCAAERSRVRSRRQPRAAFLCVKPC